MKSYEELMEEHNAILLRLGFPLESTPGAWDCLCDEHLWAAKELKDLVVAAEEAAFRDWTGTLTKEQEEEWDLCWFATTGGIVEGPFESMDDALDNAMLRTTHHYTPACYIGKIRPELVVEYEVLDSDLCALGI